MGKGRVRPLAGIGKAAMGLVTLCLLATQALAQPSSQRRRPTVAVVLSGGGAKGSAHVGALKVLEEMGVPVDMVVGTSMGALIGGLYCIGYGADQIDSLLRVQDWDRLLFDRADPRQQSLLQRQLDGRYFYSLSLRDWRTFSWGRQGLVKGVNVANLLARLTLGYHDSLSFDSLPIPFAAVATDLVRDSQVVMRQGRLSTAMRASMSIPFVFSPVLHNGMVLADGALKNNFPTDVARRMGADIVIGVSVKSDERRSAADFRSTVNVLATIADGLTDAKSDENAALCDVLIHVKTDGFSTMSFSRPEIDTLIRRGHEEALRQRDALAAIVARTGGTPRHPQHHLTDCSTKMRIGQIHSEGLYQYDSANIAKHFLKGKRARLSIDDIEDMIVTLRDGLLYNDPSYALRRLTDSTVALELHTGGKKAAQLFLGIRYDNVSRVAMQVSGLVPLPWRSVPIILQPTLRLGDRQEIRLNASLSPFTSGVLSLSYRFQHNRVDVYEDGRRAYNADYALHEVDFGMKDHGLRNLLLDLFCRWDWMAESTILSATGDDMHLPHAARLLSYYARAHYNDQDHAFLATRGTDFAAELALHTDDFRRYQGGTPLASASLRLRRAFPLGRRVTLEPMVYGRMALGKDTPAFLLNYVGGPFFGHTLDQQMPFAGTKHVAHVGRMFVAAEAELRYRLMRRHHFLFEVALGGEAPAMGSGTGLSRLIGCEVGYAYSSLLGPLGVGLGFSNLASGMSLTVNLGHEF